MHQASAASSSSLGAASASQQFTRPQTPLPADAAPAVRPGAADRSGPARRPVTGAASTAPALVPTVIATGNTPPPQIIRPGPGSQPNRMPPSGPLPLPKPPGAGGVPSGAVGSNQSGKFPDLANLATMVAEEDLDPAPENARTEIGIEPVVDPHARTSMDMQPPLANHGRGTPPSRASTMSRAPTQPPPLAGMPNGTPQVIQAQSHPHPSAPLPHQLPPNVPTQAIAAVGPSGVSAHPPGRPTPPGPPGPLPASMQPMQPLPPPPPQVTNGPFGYPVVNKAMSQQMIQGATVYPADVASPVGQHYQGNVDWDAAAAAPAKAMPPWLLAVLFIGAIGIALLITLVIAAAVR
jgi:hypothetical protein